MKKSVTTAVIALFAFTAQIAQSQESSDKKLLEMSSYNLQISNTKTSNVVFPFAIVSVDRGSKDILAQKAAGVENILQVKAAKQGFDTSNLSVVTADGKLTTFVVSFAQNPSSINLSLDPNNRPRETSIFLPKENTNEEELRKYTDFVLQNNAYTPGSGRENSGIVFHLKGLFIKDGVLYFQFKITNWSNVRYDIEQFRFFIRDLKRAKRTASQEIEVLPIYVNKQLAQIPGKSVDMYVFSLPKFTIPDQKFLAVQLMEKDGGRHIELKISNRQLLNARQLR